MLAGVVLGMSGFGEKKKAVDGIYAVSLLQI